MDAIKQLAGYGRLAQAVYRRLAQTEPAPSVCFKARTPSARVSRPQNHAPGTVRADVADNRAPHALLIAVRGVSRWKDERNRRPR